MAFGMATTKITITLPDDRLQASRELVAANRAASVSGFVQHGVGVAPGFSHRTAAAGWREMPEDALRETGGPLTRQERAWADGVVDPAGRKRGRRKAA